MKFSLQGWEVNTVFVLDIGPPRTSRPLSLVKKMSNRQKEGEGAISGTRL